MLVTPIYPTHLSQLIFNGGDERTIIHKNTQLNKYFTNPTSFVGLVNRGSCTCNTLTDFSLEVIKELDKNLE